MKPLKLPLIISLVASFWALSGPAQAELVPTPVNGDARLVTFDFDPDNTYLILTKPRAVTHLELPAGERVVTIASGDTTNWEITPTKDSRHIFIKARIETASTTMTAITDRRSYQFIIKATSEGQKWYQRVTWRIPQTLIVDQSEHSAGDIAPSVAPSALEPQVESATPQVDPDKLNFAYQVDGEAAFKPTSVFDDGTFTWIRMPSKLQELPVLFAKDERGEFMLVNYITRGDYLVAQRLAERLVLKLGKTEVTVTKREQKKSWFGGVTRSDMYGH